MKIRRLGRDELLTHSLPTQAYSFQPSPTPDDVLDRMRRNQTYYADNVTLVADDDGVVVAEVSAIPMRQNIRGSVYAMAGIAGVAAQPHVRRRGYVRKLLVELLGQMRESGSVLSVLYPFRPSFYGRFGYVGMPKTRTVRFSPAELDFLLRSELDGKVTWTRPGAGYTSYRELTHRMLPQRHGFAIFPDYRAVQLRDADDRWMITAHVGGDVVGAVTYHVTGFGERLITGDLLTTSPLSRALLLQFLARHVDQVAEIEVTVPPDELPELWATDFTVTVETRTSFPTAPAPMGRVLSLDGFRGMPVGPGQAHVEIVDDPFIAGRYLLDGMDGTLEISRANATTPPIRLTAPALSGLIYGVLDPGDIVIRGLGLVTPDQYATLSSLFPRAMPYFHARF